MSPQLLTRAERRSPTSPPAPRPWRPRRLTAVTGAGVTLLAAGISLGLLSGSAGFGGARTWEEPTSPATPGAPHNALGMKLVRVPAGKFLMGSPQDEEGRQDDEGPRREVEITRPFFLGAFEVTQQEYEAVMGTNPSWFAPGGGGAVTDRDTRRFPAESVSWEEAREFCVRLSELPEEKAAGRVYRLPTEAEWEYACRLGAPSPDALFHFGRGLSSLQANYDGNAPYATDAKGPSLQRTAAVGSYPASPLGLYDLHGNVWEWCQDWYDKNYYQSGPARDPQGPAASPVNRRALRGGAWGDCACYCRTSQRAKFGPAYRNFSIGFRVALTVGNEDVR